MLFWPKSAPIFDDSGADQQQQIIDVMSKGTNIFEITRPDSYAIIAQKLSGIFQWTTMTENNQKCTKFDG